MWRRRLHEWDPTGAEADTAQPVPNVTSPSSTARPGATASARKRGGNIQVIHYPVTFPGHSPVHSYLDSCSGKCITSWISCLTVDRVRVETLLLIKQSMRFAVSNHPLAVQLLATSCVRPSCVPTVLSELAAPSCIGYATRGRRTFRAAQLINWYRCRLRYGSRMHCADSSGYVVTRQPQSITLAEICKQVHQQINAHRYRCLVRKYTCMLTVSAPSQEEPLQQQIPLLLSGVHSEVAWAFSRY